MKRSVDISTRDALLQAALEVVARDGLRAVTHRKVAAQAGASLSSTSYHFSSIDSILLESLQYYVDRMIHQYDRPLLGATDVNELIDAVVRLIEVFHDDDVVLMYELYAQAARDPRFAALVHRWSENTKSALRRFCPDAVAIRTEAVIEGLIFQQHLGSRKLDEGEIREVLKSLLDTGDAESLVAPTSALAG